MDNVIRIIYYNFTNIKHEEVKVLLFYRVPKKKRERRFGHPY